MLEPHHAVFSLLDVIPTQTGFILLPAPITKQKPEAFTNQNNITDIMTQTFPCK